MGKKQYHNKTNKRQVIYNNLVYKNCLRALSDKKLLRTYMGSMCYPNGKVICLIAERLILRRW